LLKSNSASRGVVQHVKAAPQAVLTLDAEVQQFELQQQAEVWVPGHPVVDLEPAQPLRRDRGGLLQRAGLGADTGGDLVQGPPVGLNLTRQIGVKGSQRALRRELARYSASSSCPQAMSVPTTEPADVPMITSAAARSMPSPASPAIRPVSQAMPVTPPPPRTSARLSMTVIYTPERTPGLG
jgi:hypothetical protein